MKPLNVAIIGGGAAGFFAAISCKAHHPSANVTIYEKTNKVLSKVKVSGGGRCNVTHACFSNAQLVKFFPRGGNQLKKAFSQFSTKETVEWFESRSVKLKTEEDNRIFPVTNNSQTIIDCLVKETQKLGIEIRMNMVVSSIRKIDSIAVSDGIYFAPFEIGLNDSEIIHADKIIIATGGSPKLSGFKWLEDLGHAIVPPVPSLFTFNMPHESITALMGISVGSAAIKIQGAKLTSEGPLLIAHWGMSGPAVLKLSAFGARILNEMNYCFTVLVNWLGAMNEQQVREQLSIEMEFARARKTAGKNPFGIPNRLWLFFLDKLEISHEKKWSELSKKELNKLINLLTNDEYKVEGKTTFKEEFVTCGGVSLNDVSTETMESKKCLGLYFAGEVLDIDGLTGGFNFQSAWTTGYIAGKCVDKSANSDPIN